MLTSKRVKKSLSISGHRTSIALESDFWEALQAQASNEDITLAALISRVDGLRPDDIPLSSALRLAALRYYRSKTTHSGA